LTIEKFAILEIHATILSLFSNTSQKPSEVAKFTIRATIFTFYTLGYFQSPSLVAKVLDGKHQLVVS
jgi:hypothetical protein